MMCALRTPAATLIAVLFLAGGPPAFSDPPPDSPKDGRTYLKKPDEGIGKFVGLLYFEDPRPLADRGSKTTKVRVGTAFLVSEKHIVTCAHCISTHPDLLENGEKPYPRSKDFNAEGFGQNIYFAPGHHGTFETPLSHPAPAEVQPYGVYRVVGVNSIFKKYFEIPADVRPDDRKHFRRMHDVVVLELDRTTRPRVGGHLKLSDARLTNPKPLQAPTELIVNGYDSLAAAVNLPGGHERRSLWQLTRRGSLVLGFGPNLTVDLKQVILREWHQGLLSCTATGGASGGPIWVEADSGREVVGITLSRTEKESGSKAFGLFFTQKHIDFIKEGLKRQHVVEKNDNLSKIAEAWYGDQKLWPKIYEANRKLIGSKPGQIRAGQVLVIPE